MPLDESFVRLRAFDFFIAFLLSACEKPTVNESFTMAYDDCPHALN